MNLFELPFAENTLGSDPMTHLFDAVIAAYPDHGIVQAESKVLMIKPAAMREKPNLTYLLIQMGPDKQNTFEYFYERYNINDYLKNPIFSKAEAEDAAKLSSSEELVNRIAEKTNLNLRPEDFWTSINSLDFSGGSNPPNWYMESVYDSVYWCGNMYVQLHNDNETTTVN